MKRGTIPPHIRNFGEAIRYLREKKSMTLRALAEEVGVSAPFLSDIERNRRSTDKLAEFANALDVAEDELRRFDGRLSQELKDWINENPAFVALLEDLRTSGRPPEELRQIFFARKR